MNNVNENNLIFYQQHFESHRHQNSLRWHAFRMLTIIEGAVLLTLFKVELIGWVRNIFMIYGFLLVFVFSLITIKDQLDARAHLILVADFEKKHSILYPKPRWSRLLSGFNLMLVSLISINLLNLILSAICVFGGSISH